MKIGSVASAPVTASLVTEASTQNCIGTVLARGGCWSFLKGGFVLTSPSESATLYLQVYLKRPGDVIYVFLFFPCFFFFFFWGGGGVVVKISV